MSPLKGVVNWIQHRSLNPDDLFLASYPKSGSTWLRFMLYELIFCAPADFRHVNAKIPTVGKHFSLSPLHRYGFGRLIKTHEPYRREYSRAIYLLRDPRDVVVSEYHYQRMARMIPDSERFDAFLSAFLRKGVNRFGTWKENVNSWCSAATGNDRILLVRFEDIKSDALGTLRKIVDFLEIDGEDDRLVEIIESNSLAGMKRKERIGRDRTFRGARGDIPFVRKGRAGGWREVLTDEQVERIEENLLNELRLCGYEVKSHVPTSVLSEK